MSKLMIQTFFPKSYDWITSSSSSSSPSSSSSSGSFTVFLRTHIFFFGSIIDIGHDIGRYILNDLLFPDHVAEQCPEAEIVINLYTCMGDDVDGISDVRIRIRQPCLALCAAFGWWIGYRAVVDLSSSLSSFPPQTPKRRREVILWMVAFGAFGLMNVSALPLHCFLDGPTESATTATATTTTATEIKTYPDENPVLWMIDTYMTGLSSICLYLASLDHIMGTFPRTYTLLAPSRTTTPSRPSPVHLATRLRNFRTTSTASIHQFIQRHFDLLWKFGWFLHGVGLACMICFVVSSPASKEADMQNQHQHQQQNQLRSLSSFSSVGLELWYLFTPPIAAVPVVCMIFGHYSRRNCFPERYFWAILNDGRLVFLIGAFIGLTGVLFDRTFCEIFGTYLRDLFGASTSVFLGCDCCFLGIYQMILSEQQEQQEQQQGRQISDKAK